MAPELLEHLVHPHNPGQNPKADGVGRRTNDCDETLEIWIEVADDRVVRAGFWSRACVHVTACASAAASAAEGLEIQRLGQVTAARIDRLLGGLPPTERHCADFAAEVLHDALLDYLSHRREDPWKKLYR